MSIFDIIENCLFVLAFLVHAEPPEYLNECECQCVPPCLCACELVYASFSVFNQRRTARLGPISSDEPSTSKASVPVRYKGCLHTGSDRIPVGIAS